VKPVWFNFARQIAKEVKATNLWKSLEASRIVIYVCYGRWYI